MTGKHFLPSSWSRLVTHDELRVHFLHVGQEQLANVLHVGVQRRLIARAVHADNDLLFFRRAVARGREEDAPEKDDQYHHQDILPP